MHLSPPGKRACETSIYRGIIGGLKCAQQGVPETLAYDLSRTATFREVIKSRMWFVERFRFYRFIP